MAIKKMDNIFDDETDCKRILREITILRSLKHPCVVELIEILIPGNVEDFKTILLVLEFAESDLKKVLKSTLNLEILHIQTIVYNLLCALKYMHGSKVIHRDLKPANILINEDCSVKLCDFGLARSVIGMENSSEMILKDVEKQEKLELVNEESCSPLLGFQKKQSMELSATAQQKEKKMSVSNSSASLCSDMSIGTN